jgi:ParB family chromosome partitioning protein
MVEVKYIDTKELEANPYQPRVEFDEGKLRELADSIKGSGLLQPIIVREHGNKYQVIAGERRLRAFRLVGIERIPVIVRETADKQMLVESFIENIQRSDLTSIERENAVYELWKSGEFASEKELAKKLGYKHTTVTEIIEAKEFRDRVVALPSKVSTHAIVDTQGLDDETRLNLLEKAERGEIRTGEPSAEIYEVVRVLKKAPEPLKQAVMKGEVKLERAKEAVQLYEEIGRKEGKPIPENKVARHVAELKRAQVDDEAQSKIRRRQAEAVLSEQPKLDQEQFQHWADELEQDPPHVQEANRLRWNLERIDNLTEKLRLPPSFYTTSYSGRDIATFVELMKAGEVGTVYDIRDTPFSQFRPEFNKESLAKALKEAGIVYKHVPELGIKREVRDEGLKTKEKHDLIKQIGKDFDGARSEPFALLCAERDPHKCHRHRLALYLMKEWSVDSIDI